MGFKIGFDGGADEENIEITAEKKRENEPVKIKNSLVRVYFEERDSAYSYYNDSFDLKCGDIVWVEGKLEGIRGRVVEINYNFKIKLSDYKRVIGVADTDVKGKFKLVGPYFVTDVGYSYFDTVKSWFVPPETQQEDVIVGNDDKSFNINDLTGMNILNEEAEKGMEYFNNNKVAYIGISGGEGKAIIEGHKPYFVEFEYADGEISNLICDCFETGACRHEFAAMLTLKEIIGHVETFYPDMNINDDGFSAIRKVDFFKYVIDSKDYGVLRFE